MDKIDFKKTMKNLYRATNKVERVQPGEGTSWLWMGRALPAAKRFKRRFKTSTRSPTP